MPELPPPSDVHCIHVPPPPDPDSKDEPYCQMRLKTRGTIRQLINAIVENTDVINFPLIKLLNLYPVCDVINTRVMLLTNKTGKKVW